MILFLYAILFFLVLRFSVTLFNFLSNPKLGLSLRHYTDLVSICMPVRTFPSVLTVDSLLEQDYRHIEVLIELTGDPLEDQKWIRTYYLHEKVRLLPAGTEITKEAQGQYLLFLHAMVQLENGSLHSMLHRMKVFRLTLLSIIPAQVSTGLRDFCAQPLYTFVLLGLVPLRLIRLSGSSLFVAGSSECMLFDKNIYFKSEWLNGLVPADLGGIETIRLVKDHQLKTETLLGGRLVTSYAYGSAEQIFRHTGERLYSLLGRNMLVLLLYLILVIAGPLAMFGSLEWNLLILPAGLIFLSRIMQSFLSGHPVIQNLILHPIQMLFLAVSLIFTATGRLIRTQRK